MNKNSFDPFTYMPDQDGMMILFIGCESGAVCWTDMMGDAITDTYGSNVNPDEILTPLGLIKEAIPSLFDSQISTWGEDGLKKGDVWVKCRAGDEKGAVRCDGEEIKHTALSPAIHATLEEKLDNATQQIRIILGVKRRKDWKSAISQTFGLGA